MKLFAFAASLRTGSFNRQLLEIAVEHLKTNEILEVDLVDFQDLVSPNYNQDEFNQSGLPEPAQRFLDHLMEADGLLIASPEYNYSIPGTVKNVIDWVSRIRPIPFRGKTAQLLSASTSQVGGIRGLWQLRIPLEGLGVHVMPDMYALPSAPSMFDESGNLVEEQRIALLHRMLDSFVDITGRISRSE